MQRLKGLKESRSAEDFGLLAQESLTQRQTVQALSPLVHVAWPPKPRAKLQGCIERARALARVLTVNTVAGTAGLSGAAQAARADVHPNITCDGCGASPIRGVRFQCSLCPDFDLCGACQARNLHPEHPLVQLRTLPSLLVAPTPLCAEALATAIAVAMCPLLQKPATPVVNSGPVMSVPLVAWRTERNELHAESAAREAALREQALAAATAQNKFVLDMLKLVQEGDKALTTATAQSSLGRTRSRSRSRHEAQPQQATQPEQTPPQS